MKRKLRKSAALTALAAVLLAGGAALPRAAAAEPDTRIPILTYHDLTRDPENTDSMTITDERFRLDMEFLQEFGYTPLLPKDLVTIQQGNMEMPDKPVMVTFDDGYQSNYAIAYPILQQTGMKAVISVVAYNMESAEEETPSADDNTEDAALQEPAEPMKGVSIENPEDLSRSHLSWSEMREMVASGLVEIGSHTYNSHNPQYGGNGAPDGINGVMRRKNETFAQYSERMGDDLEQSIALIVENTGQAQVNYFAYPFGAYDSWMDQLLDKAGVAVSVWSNNGKSADIADGLRNLPRYGIKMEKSVAQLLQQTDTALPALATVSVNGKQSKLPAYNIGGNNYVRVRDVAVLLMDTENGFDVQWNSARNCVELTSQAAYEPIGTENKPLPKETRLVQSFTEPTVADGTTRMVASYQVDGYTYYKLRSLGELCGFQVAWDEAEQVVEVTA